MAADNPRMSDDEAFFAPHRAAATVRVDDPPTGICGVICAAGPNGEPLACAYPRDHEGVHSWATLPTFGGDDA